ncbi:MAG: sodium-translocating pyrophosphatase [Dehalococcoidia bacterium]|nr:MAG: sodium-translocating pyrophosphatase [Dehalococcoidia bacterium]
MNPMIVAVICGALGLGLAGFMASYVLKQEQGSDKMRQISAAIREGALAFLGREYKILFIFVTVVAIVLGVVPMLGWWVTLAFVFGAVCSALAGYIGMNMAIRANSRTAAAAQKSLSSGLRVSFRSGAVMGLCVVGIGILGMSVLYFAFHSSPDFLKIIPGFGFGASSVAIFARVGGGIFTKAADTGADIVGKVEKGIPEDDPRNAAVIADFVGDNVGDVAGMGADLFESYVDSIIATMALGTIAAFSITLDKPLVPNMATAWFLPMIVVAGGIIASIIGIFLVRVGEKAKMGALLNALRRGTFSASALTAVFAFLAVYFLKADIGIFWAILVGLIAGVLIGESTNYFTSYSYKPTLQISNASQTGAGTLLTRGFANGLMSTLPPIILVVVAIIVAHHFADIYGIAIAGVGMLSTLGIQDATDAYGPVADNAGGIVEMSDLPPEVRERTDALDSLGNTTAATGKGFAIGAAGLTALALLLAYTQAVGIKFADISLLDPHVISGILLGVMLPAIFCAMTLNAVGKTSFSIVNEVRRQFREIKGLMEGKARPEYGKCVDICTRDALKQMIAPGILTIVSPIIVGLILGPLALGGFLMGAVGCGFILAITFANAGGSWDNAKKWIERGAFGGKGSDAHKAAVVGDMVGDPMKDTAGPSLNIMIKLMSIVALVLAPVLVLFGGVI